MLYLLDDEDEQVIKEVETGILNLGPKVIPMLENYWQNNEDPLRAFRIENLIRSIQDRELEKDLKLWLAGNGSDLLEAFILVNRIHYPSYNYDFIHRFVSEITMDCWLMLYNAIGPDEKVFILNQVFFQKYGFKGNVENYNHPDNSFISRVIETKKGNPISLCSLYSIVAQRLGIPVFGVNLPHHFILAYCEDNEEKSITGFEKKNAPLNREDYGSVQFYINPFKQGHNMSQNDIKAFLQKMDIQEQVSFFEPCSNIDIIQRMLRNLHFAYNEQQDHTRLLRVIKFMQLLGMEDDSLN